MSNKAIIKFASQLPGYVFVKDEDGRFIYCNDKFCQRLAVPHYNDLVGKTDNDLPWSVQEVKQYMIDDAYVIENNQQKTNILETQSHDAETGIQTVITNKYPYCDSNGRSHGIIGYYNVLDHEQVDTTLLSLVSAENFSFILERIEPVEIISDNRGVMLSNRQALICLLILKGCTAKVIAAGLLISPRTAESHIKLIKDKFSCRTRNQLIQKLLKGGFIRKIFYLPTV